MGDLLERFMDGFPLKSLMSLVLMVCVNAEVIVFFSFTWMVFLDCLTRWLAISYGYLVGEGKVKPSLLQCFKAIPSARRAGLIKSEVMRQKGVDKIILYTLCALSAAACDLILTELHAPACMTGFVMGYMAMTELLSIIENLSEAGVDSLNRLVMKLKGRL